MRLKKFTEVVTRLLRSFLGEMNYTPPPWIRQLWLGSKTKAGPLRKKLENWCSHHQAFAYTILGVALTTGAGSYPLYRWYKNRPKPRTVQVTLIRPALTPIEENAKPNPIVLQFSESVARLKDDKKPVRDGILLNPEPKGLWRWESDRKLVFFPDQDWPIDQEYKIRLSRDLLASQVLLENYSFEFRTEPFAAHLTEKEFYQNPENPREKKGIFTIKFSHPVDGETLRRLITLQLKELKETSGFNLLFGKLNGEAYIHSDNIQIPERDSSLTVTIAKGIKALKGGNSTAKELKEQINIPGMYNFFKIQGTTVNLVPNDKFEVDQVLAVETSTEVLETEIRKGLEAYLLPIEGTDKKPYPWRSASEVTAEVLTRSQKISLELIPNEREASTSYHYKISAPVGRSLMIKVPKGLKSVGDYVLYNDHQDILQIPPFPREVKIMHAGAILSFHGEKKLSLLARGIEAVRFQVGRVIPGEINHLISQSEGGFNHPSFRYEFNEENITEQYQEIRKLPRNSEGKMEYFNFDLGKYLTSGTIPGNKKGLFFLKVQPWNPKTNTAAGQPEQRFILISDLGILTKTSVDRSHDLFVQSFHSGGPVAGAQVEVIGKNGIAVLNATTDAQGHVRLPSLLDFKKERTPVGFVVRKEQDLSFLPLGRTDRQLSFSRFDIAGISTSPSEDKLNAYLFSERGIYRPGDEFHIGMIVRSQDWKLPLAGLPLEATVSDPRGLVVHKERLALNAEGFVELNYRTEESSPTGHYSLALYLVQRDADLHEKLIQLGSTAIRVEEFLPDTLKIFSRLSSERQEGWISPKNLKALVTLRNLFGTPAEKHRVTASIGLSPYLPTFRKFLDFHFFDSLKPKEGHSELIEPKMTNEKGEADFELNLDKFAKGTYRLIFSAEGFAAEGGRSVSTVNSAIVSPLAYLVGYRSPSNLGYLKVDSSHEIHLIAVDPTLTQIQVPELNAQLIEVKTVSILAREPNGTFRYESVRKEVPVETKKLTIEKAGTQFKVDSGKPGEFILVLQNAEGLELQRIPYSIVGQTNLQRKLSKNSELELKLAKSDYSPGEEIELQITAPYTGSGLITIEREKVLASKWFKTESTNSVQKIRLPEGIEGGAYVNVSFVRNLGSKEIYTSPLSYAVAPFSIARDRRTHGIEIDHPDLIKPGTSLSMKVKVRKRAKVAVFAVDEGILQVAGYTAPNPLGHFFRKRALEVSTEQILDLILPEFSISQLTSASGGDGGAGAIGKNLNPFKRKRDKPVVYWSGLHEVGPAGETLDYLVPDSFNGTLRVFAVAVSSDSIGVFEDQATVRGNFVISPNVPTFTTPGDEFTVGVSLANNAEGSGPGAQIKLELKSSEHLKVLDPSIKILAVGEAHETSTQFRIQAQDVLGSGNLTFVASLGDQSVKFSTDLSVRPAMPLYTRLLAGRTQDATAELDVTRNLYPHFREQEISVSTVPLNLSHGLMKYLNTFPYGCTEQLLSKVFPLVVLKSRPEFVQVTAGAEKNYREMVHLLRSRQASDGAMGIWSATSGTSLLYTAYTYHFLTEANERGFSPPKEMMTRMENYFRLQLKSDPGSIHEARTLTYALYLMARNGIVAGNELVSLRKVLDENFKNEWKKDLAVGLVAATYKLYKQEREANELAHLLRIGEAQTADYERLYDQFFHDASALYLLSRHFPEKVRELPGVALDHLVRPIQEGTYNTLSSSFAVLALDAYASAVGSPSQFKELLVKQRIQPNPWELLTLPGGTIPRMGFSSDASRLQIQNGTGTAIFYQVLQTGFDRTPPSKEIKEKIEIFREIRDEKGGPLKLAEIGKEYEVHVKTRALSAPVSHVAIVDLLPGGFEVVLQKDRPTSPPRQSEGENEGEGDESSAEIPGENAKRGIASRVDDSGSTWTPDFVDIREDRVLIFGRVETEVQEFVYRVKAVTSGTFKVPPILGEGMYDRSVRSLSLGEQIEIKAPAK